MRASIIVTLLSLLLKTLAELENGIESDVIPRQVEESGGGVQKRDGIPLAPQDLPPPKKEEPKKDEPNKDEPEQGIPVAPQDLPPKKEAPPAAPEAPKEEQGIPVTPQDLLPKKEAPLAGNTNKEEEGEVLVADDRVPKNEDEETTMAKASNIQLPPSLKLDDFDTVVSERLTLVEFFSPYCSHCKTLAPIWRAAYTQFYSEMKELNIQMRQVNCVENGDLCEREDISFYPNMKLYSPVKDAQTKEIIPGKHKNVGTFPRALPRTVENFKKYLKNAVAEYDEGSIDLPSSSVLLNQQDLFKLAAGEGEEPVFVSFYAASDENYQNSEEKTKDDFPMGCFDCKHISQVWAKLSNQVLSTVKTGHMNCLTNKLACKQLGLDKLIEENSRANIAPRFIMFLPGVTGLTRIEYDQEIELQAMKKWTNRLMENYLFETINARTLPEVLDVKKSLPFEPLNSYYPLSNKMLLIFYHKDIELSQEDRAMLSYILLYVTNLPFNINIYLSSDEKILEYIQAQAKNMVEFINYDDSSTEPVHTFLAPRFVTTTLTHIPTLMMFKENTLITPIYQNFAIEDMRNNLKVKEFIDRNQFPLYQELTPSLLDVYFPSKFPSPRNKDSVITKTDKVVVAFIDSNDASLTNSQLFNLSLIAHEYSHIKKEYYFESLLSKRDDKRVLVDHLVRQDKDSLEIVAAMRQEIPHYFQNDEVLFTFIDVSTNADLAKDLGWDVTGEKYQVGDAIIVSRNDKFYWNKDITGTEILKIDPYKLKPVLQYLLNPKLVTETHKNVYVSSILIGSPFSNSLRYLDLVHSHGFLGYIYLWAALYAAYYIFRKLRRRRGGGHPRLPKSHTGLGILGKKD